jgi:hypothetical protein
MAIRRRAKSVKKQQKNDFLAIFLSFLLIFNFFQINSTVEGKNAELSIERKIISNKNNLKYSINFHGIQLEKVQFLSITETYSKGTVLIEANPSPKDSGISNKDGRLIVFWDLEDLKRNDIIIEIKPGKISGKIEGNIEGEIDNKHIESKINGEIEIVAHGKNYPLYIIAILIVFLVIIILKNKHLIYDFIINSFKKLKATIEPTKINIANNEPLSSLISTKNEITAISTPIKVRETDKCFIFLEYDLQAPLNIDFKTFFYIVEHWNEHIKPKKILFRKYEDIPFNEISKQEAIQEGLSVNRTIHDPHSKKILNSQKGLWEEYIKNEEFNLKNMKTKKNSENEIKKIQHTIEEYKKNLTNVKKELREKYIKSVDEERNQCSIQTRIVRVIDNLKNNANTITDQFQKNKANLLVQYISKNRPRRECGCWIYKGIKFEIEYL